VARWVIADNITVVPRAIRSKVGALGRIAGTTNESVGSKAGIILSVLVLDTVLIIVL
jgi:hypothetical protein